MSKSIILSFLAGLARHQADAKREEAQGLSFAGRDAGYYEHERLIGEAWKLDKMANDIEEMVDRLKAQLDKLERFALDNNLPEALAWLQERRAAIPRQFVLDTDKKGRPIIREIETPCSSQS